MDTRKLAYTKSAMEDRMWLLSSRRIENGYIPKYIDCLLKNWCRLLLPQKEEGGGKRRHKPTQLLSTKMDIIITYIYKALYNH